MCWTNAKLERQRVWRSQIRKVGVLATVTFLLASTIASAQTTVDLTLTEARALATQALFAGNSGLALDVARAVLTQAPDDRAALTIVAAAAPQQGDPRAGRIAGARAFALSQNNVQRYEAARLTALAAANEQRLTLASFWLRRALIVASSDEERAQTISDARLLRRQNPWSFDVSGALAPSSNVNGGAAESDVPDLFGLVGSLSDAALQQPGFRATLGLNIGYRLQESTTSRTTIGAQYQMNRVKLTNDVALPDDAFATDVAELSLRHDQALDNGSITGRLTTGKFIYRQLIADETESQNRFANSLRLGLDRRLPIGAQSELTLSFDRGITNYEDTRIGQVRRSGLGASLAHILPSGDLLSTGVSYAKSDASNQAYISTEWTLRGSYNRAEAIGPFSFGVSGGVTWSDYPEYVLFAGPDGRQDTTLFYGINIGFPDVSYAGFTPALTVSGSSTDSNVSRFTRDALSVGLSISSQF